ncbi:MAG: transketolase family protein [Oscillospiraceae bacterium]|jgi:transketolase|nr:transketolase family protein [Oscillospiraceae bacterium]
MSEVKLATRDAYGQALAELGAINPKLIVMDADLAAATKTGVFAKAYPDRFFDAGIAEQNLVGVAAGLSAVGYTVFASSFAMFAAGRAFEQIRNSLGYPRLSVNIGATHAGISVGEDGASHQCCEDIALMRTIPGMTVINPADDVEARAAVFAAAELPTPCYLRFGRLAVPRVNREDYKFELGKAVTLREGNDMTIIATGLMVAEALAAAAALDSEGISAAVLNIHTIKPLDEEAVLAAAAKTGLLVTAEEHSIIGGLGSAVAELVSEKSPCRVLRVGVRDKFGRSGPALEMLRRYGLDAKTIAETVRQAVSK